MPAAPSPLLLLRVGEGRGDAAAQSLSKITQYPRLGQARNGPTPRLPFIRNSKRTGGPTVAAATMQAKSTQNSLGSISILLVRLNFGQRLRASRKAPIQYSACAKRAVWIVTRPPKREFNRKSGPTRRWTSWWPRQEGWLDGSPSAYHVAKVAKVSNAVARVGPQSRRLGTAPRGCLRWRCQCAWSSNDWYTT